MRLCVASSADQQADCSSVRQILDRDARKCSHAVKLYMLELYQDELMDLLRPRAADSKARGAASTPEVHLR